MCLYVVLASHVTFVWLSVCMRDFVVLLSCLDRQYAVLQGWFVLSGTRNEHHLHNVQIACKIRTVVFDHIAPATTT